MLKNKNNKMLLSLTIIVVQVAGSVSAQQAWFSLIEETFDNASFPLHGCFGRNNIAPTQGSECGPKHKTCFFGNQVCNIDEAADNVPYPSESCTCNGSSGSFGTWDCQPKSCPCKDAVLELVPWTDADGDSCLAYAQNDGLCNRFGSILQNHGLTASQACCACGGGGGDDSTSGCVDTLVPTATDAPIIPWLDSVGGNCSWYAQDPPTRCIDFANEVDYRLQFMPVGEACCACKGIVTAPTTSVCTDLPDWTTSSNRTCSEVTRQDCFYNEESFGISTAEACCKCGLRQTDADPTTSSFTRPTAPTSIGCSSDDDFDICIKLSPNMVDIAAFTTAHDTWNNIIVGDSIDMMQNYDVLNATTDFIASTQDETMTIQDLHEQLCGYQPEFTTTSTTTTDGIDVCVNQRILREGIVASVATVFGDDFTRFGVVEWNADTIRSVRDDGLLDTAMLQQVGHVLGLGMLWESTAPDQVNLDGTDCSYTGEKANGVYQDVSECSAASSTLPFFNFPTELSFDLNDGGGNWTVPLCGQQLDPECFLREQRVIVVDDSDDDSTTVSTLTVAMLDDLGYTVDYDQVDAFTKADLNASCICSDDADSSIDSDQPPLEPPPLLSLEGRRKIVAYAKEELRRMNEIALSYMTTNGGVGIAGLTIFYMEEDGTIFTEYVVNGEGEYIIEEYYYDYDELSKDATATTRRE